MYGKRSNNPSFEEIQSIMDKYRNDAEGCFSALIMRQARLLYALDVYQGKKGSSLRKPEVLLAPDLETAHKEIVHIDRVVATLWAKMNGRH